MSIPSVNANKLKRKMANAYAYARKSEKVIRRKRKIRSSSEMSVNTNVLKEVNRNPIEDIDIKLKTEET